ncbi:cob(I)yrinic acid a,c-diamide adenosyltransferase [Alicyclobacillus dauci]|uniref:Corrinoid adenosyltransferase n=1 Tax=Alicyclobacillus dauci TaxID=1475485 RepID=A0ABY6Z7I5_9BACL|nr:cob(I)yrinic acid a,c-diamide adenosyltransferase [Alicyclobacillus dauci]WAH38710.1 cob(I)yrinic acid a,c-diamide adenosyltransferase [Alicyclobacillus dauci]
MRIYTRGGDQGKTTLIGGERRLKSDLRVEAYGTVDEAGAFLGFAASQLPAGADRDIQDVIAEIAQTLWDVGADLAAPESANFEYRTADESVTALEPLIDRYQAEADKLDKFVLRQGHPAAAALHVACTVVRRAERNVVRLREVEPVHEPALRYLNRLSDLLFVLARSVNVRYQRAEIDYENSPSVFRG